MATKSLNRVHVSTATTGTGTVTLGAASAANALTFLQAGAADADLVNYVLEEGADFEIGVGTIGGTSTTLTRDTVHVSKIGATVGTTKMTLAGDAKVRSAEPADLFNHLFLGAEAIKIAGYTVVLNDRNKVIVGNNASAMTFALTAAADLGTSFTVAIRNIGAGDITINPDGAETIDGVASIVLKQHQSVIVFGNGTAFRTLFWSRTRVADMTDVDFTTPPADGDTLVYDFASSTWKPEAAAATATDGPGFGLAAAVASNALTISLKGADGNDPAAGNPVSLAFRNVSLPTGTPSVLTATAALSLVISSGSTLGFTSATAGRIWIVAFNDGGTLRLGAINCRSGTDIYPLGGTKVASSTAEGGAGAADSAHVFYTGTAVTSKAFKILGYMDWSAGLTTAGTWAIVPTTIKLFDLGDKLPGDVIQSVSSTTQTNTTTTNTTFVDTTSVVTMVPSAAPNVVAVVATGPLGIVAASGDKRSQARLSRGGSQIGMAAQNLVAYSGTVIISATLMAMDTPNTTSSCTWKVQINATDASQTALWGHSGLGGVAGAYMSATEIMG